MLFNHLHDNDDNDVCSDDNDDDNDVCSEVPASRQLFNKMGREDNFYIRLMSKCKDE